MQDPLLATIIRRSWYVVPRSASLIYDDRSTLRLAVEIINNMRTLHDAKISAGLFCNLLKRGSRLHISTSTPLNYFLITSDSVTQENCGSAYSK